MSGYTNKTRADIPRPTVPPGEPVTGEHLAKFRDDVKQWGDSLPLAGRGFSAQASDVPTFTGPTVATTIAFEATILDTHGWQKESSDVAFASAPNLLYVVPEGCGGVYVCSWQAQFVRQSGTGTLWYGLHIKSNVKLPNRVARDEWVTFCGFDSANVVGDMESRTSIEMLFPGDQLWMEYAITDASSFDAGCNDTYFTPSNIRALQVWQIGQPPMPLDDTLRGTLIGNLEGPYLLYDTRNWLGGSSKVLNEGLAGHTYDLTMFTVTATRKYAEYGYVATSWATFGGLPSTKAITFMWRMNTYVGSPTLQAVGQIDFGSGLSLLEGLLDRFGSSTTGFIKHYDDLPTSNQEMSVNYRSSAAQPYGAISFSDSLFVLTIDYAAKAVYIWRDGVDVSAELRVDTLIGAGTTTNVDVVLASPQLYVYLGDVNPPASGAWPNNVRSMAMFRNVPNATDLATWQAYFA